MIWILPFWIPFLTFCFTSANKSPRRNVNCRLVWFQFRFDFNLFFQSNEIKNKNKKYLDLETRLYSSRCLTDSFSFASGLLFTSCFLFPTIYYYFHSTSLVIFFFLCLHPSPLSKTFSLKSQCCCCATPQKDLKKNNNVRRRKQTQLFLVLFFSFFFKPNNL